MMGNQDSGDAAAIESLLALSDAVGKSGILSDDEVRQVLLWVRDNQQTKHPDIQALVALARVVLADKKVTTDERAQLHQALREFHAKHSPAVAPSEPQPAAKGPAKPAPPATERQKEYARELGIDFPENIDRRAISDLIDEAVAKRDDERYARLNALEAREQAARDQLREEILAELDTEDCRLSKATTQQMVDELAARGIGAVLITFKLDEVDDFENLLGVGFQLECCEDEMDEREMKLVASCVGVGMLRQLTN